MRKRILVALACVMAFGWTCLSSAVANEKAAGTKTTVSDPNEKGCKKEGHKKHEGKKKGHEKKCEDANSTGKKA
jgi:hypothetical protein